MKSTEKPQTKAKKIYNIVSTIIVAAIFVFLVVVVALILWQRNKGGDSSLFGYYMFDVVTDSMSGTIEPGEVIISKKVDDAKNLKVGDIITFVAPSGQFVGHNITHRIYEVINDGEEVSFRTKGDKKGVGVDDWILPSKNVKAVYVKTSVFIGGLRKFLSHWYGYVFLIALPLCIVGVLLIVGYVRDRVAHETEKLAAENNIGGSDKVSLDDMSEEQKKRLLNEFLAEQKEKSVATEQNEKVQDTSDENERVSDD